MKLNQAILGSVMYVFCIFKYYIYSYQCRISTLICRNYERKNIVLIGLGTRTPANELFGIINFYMLEMYQIIYLIIAMKVICGGNAKL